VLAPLVDVDIAYVPVELSAASLEDLDALSGDYAPGEESPSRNVNPAEAWTYGFRSLTGLGG